jgi:hypothetical protein
MWLAQADHIIQLDIWEHNNSLTLIPESPTKLSAVDHP